MGTAKKPAVRRIYGVSRTPHRGLAVAGILLGTLLLPALTGCQQTETRPVLPTVTEPPLNVVESSQKYGPVIDDIRRALEDEFPDISWRAGDAYSIGERTDGQCSLRLPSFRSNGDVVGASDEFQRVMDTINPVLEPNGFSRVSVLDEGSKGWWSVTSGNAQGARVRIFGRTSVDLTLSVPVEAGPCSDEELAVLDP
ncbi:hypothetical protein F8G81_22345 [Arthrobacter sp. CDRTa11]|uniref:hypothetical protein n=1 Tax=Arthrobacter sp. CDRTa11 TaxID=2651199 RepID=UPI002265C486|nr:hypothetical protein [Arthrobacter sp. CDRTa11]UZX05028.1 hypothetical protein F8G81_22345 [Arthrobacter sp. CDRTa11]